MWLPQHLYDGNVRHHPGGVCGSLAEGTRGDPLHTCIAQGVTTGGADAGAADGIGCVRQIANATLEVIFVPPELDDSISTRTLL